MAKPMTEGDWNSCADPEAMLYWLDHWGKLTDRKARLFAVAVCRRIWPLLNDKRSREAVEVAERHADGAATTEELLARGATADAAFKQTDPGCPRFATNELAAAFYAAAAAVEPARWDENCLYAEDVTGLAASAASYAEVPRSLWGTAAGDEAFENGVRQAHAEQCGLLRDLFGPLPFRPVAVGPSLLRWNDGTVVKVARGIYDDRAFDRMPLLADALLDAGCEDEAVLAHCREQGSVHARGCWVLGLLLNKG
jgi:hypothetical protein